MKKNINKRLKLIAGKLLIALLSLIILISIVKIFLFDFRPVCYYSVEKIVLIKRGDFLETKDDSVCLTKSQAVRFAYSWNSAMPIGPCKFLPVYQLNVYYNDGLIRCFVISGPIIKESGKGSGFNFLFNKNLIESVWAENKKKNIN